MTSAHEPEESGAPQPPEPAKSAADTGDETPLTDAPETSALSRPALWVALAVLAGVALRLLHLWSLYSADSLLLTPIVDAQAYHQWGLAILHDPIGDKVYFQSPGYPYLLGLFYAIFGTSWFKVALLQALAAGVSIWLIARIVCLTRKDTPTDASFGWPAVIAAWALALYQPLIYYSPLVLKVEFTNLFLLLTLHWYLCGLKAPDKALRWLFGAGFSLYFLVLLRGNFLLAFPPLLLWLVVHKVIEHRAQETPINKRKVASLAMAFAGGFLLFMSIVTVRNGLVSGQWATSTAAAGPVLYYGNNPHSPLGDFTHVPFVRPNPKYEEIDFRREAERRNKRTMTTQEANRYWWKTSRHYIFSNPWLTTKRVIHKLRLVVESYEMGDNYSLQFHRQFSWVLWLLFPWWAFVLAIAAGALLASKERWYRTMPIHIVVWTYLASLLIFYVISRYRIPLAPMLIVLGVLEGEALYQHFLRKEWPTIWRHSAVIVGVLVLSLSLGMPKQYGEKLGVWWASLGRRHLDQGHKARALALLLKAKQVEPTNSSVWLSLGKYYLRDNQTRRAAVHCQKAIDLGAGRQGARECLAFAKMHMKDLIGAAIALRPIVHPRMPVMRCLLWTAILELSGRRAEAVQTLRNGLKTHGPHPQLKGHLIRILRSPPRR